MEAAKGINIGVNVVKFTFAIVGVILAALIMFKWDAKLENESDILPFLDGSYWMSLVGLVICTVVAVLFGLFQFITKIGKNKGGLIGLIAFVVILAVSFGVMAKTDILDYRNIRGGKFLDADLQYNGLTDFWLTFSEGGIYAVYILVAIAVLVAVVAEVSKIVK